VAGIWHDEAAGAWLAEMRSTAYAFGLADGGAALRHLHWGAPLARAALAGLLTAGTGEMPRHERRLSLGRERPDEYVPWGGLRYDEPSLKAEFGDGTRSVEWRVTGHRVTREGPVCTLEVDLADPAYPLRVTLAYRVYDGFDVLERWATLDPDGTATEEDGELWSGALAWSGSWRLVFETNPGGRVHACGGVNDFDWAYRLGPGDELVLPRFAGLYATGGFGAASREWHAWQLAHVLGRGDDRADHRASLTAPGLAPAPRTTQARTTQARAASAGPPPLRPVAAP
jgi:alpha-galactosidase